MAARRIVYLAALGAVTVFYAAYGEWFSWIALLATVVLPWVSLLLSLPAMCTCRIEPVATPRVQMGEETQVRLLALCRLPVPPFRGRMRLERSITNESWTHKTEMILPTEHCGVITASAQKVRVYDYLGLFSLRVRTNSTQRIIIAPRPLAVPSACAPERFIPRAWRPKLGGGFSENHELRLYRPGDSLNQVHWKLTAKTGKLILREPMQPERGLVLVTMHLRGTPDELDRKFGRLLWLGRYLLEKNVQFELRVLTADGISAYAITDESALSCAIDALLGASPASEGDLRALNVHTSWRYHIGGEPDAD